MSRIFTEHAVEERGESARMSSFVGAIAVGDLVKSTLGPKGMDKILQSASTGEIVVTNDGATILRSISLDNAAAKALVNVSITQDNEVGDGTTSVTVLAAELLREAERLIDSKIHPQTVIDGYRIATNIALNALYKSSVDHKDNSELFRRDLENIARTTLSSKILSQDQDHFSKLAVDAVFRSASLENIQIIKKLGGRLKDSYLDEGFILEKRIGVNQPKRLENVKILVANTPMDTDKVKVFGARVRVNATSKLAELEKAEKEKMKAKVERIKAHGINCFINRQLIYNWPEQLFADAGIISIEHADFDGIERLALVTGGEIASTFDHPEYVKLGKCDLIEEIIIGEDKMIKFSGVAAGEACTIVLRGATSQLLDEAERSLHDALAVLLQTMNDSKITLGGGCSEILMAKAVDSAASKESGKKVHAIEAFARALRTIPMILASNAGFDSNELVSLLRSAHYNGMTSYGLDLINGEIADMRDTGVVESYKLKHSVVSSASEVAEMLLRVDTILKSTPRPRTR
ncbi:T-complex protein 1, beta subunit [Pneumocystis jirovecii RU7]|uniref:CCT-beta n=1 Tax=Pneumocystis jirovecii (strain RU7) TaxID=1408657 RepID=A0A0W4ZUH9_PNEJ7|nr:T-complex protein 1, beta subunit [Pneumocystis jirovecii RU7]KTW32028.1 T-complex protein 1, beta subunit [Pneumocystis jirovecii RU7]